MFALIMTCSVSLSGMKYFRITLLRSAIGLPGCQRDTLNALGLRKRLRTVYHPVTRDIAGMIFRVKELVDVQTTSHFVTRSEIKLARKPPPGFYIERPATLTSPIIEQT